MKFKITDRCCIPCWVFLWKQNGCKVASVTSAFHVLVTRVTCSVDNDKQSKCGEDDP